MDNTFATVVDWKTECEERAKACAEMHEKIKNLQIENTELKAHIDAMHRDAKYTVGLVDGLKFALRCNGVSGAEVRE